MSASVRRRLPPEALARAPAAEPLLHHRLAIAGDPARRPTTAPRPAAATRCARRAASLPPARTTITDRIHTFSVLRRPPPAEPGHHLTGPLLSLGGDELVHLGSPTTGQTLDLEVVNFLSP